MKNRMRMKTMAAVALAAALAVSSAGTAVMAAAAESGTASDGSSDQDRTNDSAKGGPGGDGQQAPPDGNGQGGPGGDGQQTPPDGNGGPGGDGQQAPPDGNGQGGPGGSGGPGGANTQTYDYDGELSGALTADGEEVTSDGDEISADTADENAALAENGGTLTITNGTLTKSGDDTDGDNCNFYGINSIVLAVGEETKAYITDTALSAESAGSNGIFSTDNATVYAKGDTITTTADNSRGLDATYGGTIVADDLTIDTEGDHCAGAATDRGGGNISLTDSEINTSGSGSPILYSTGDIEVSGVTGTAEGSQIAGMEGLNTILIYDSELTSEITSATASDPVANGVIIYQSTSGDAETATGETATFQAVDSTLKSSIESGAMFYITNTRANVLVSGTTLDYDSSAADLLKIEGNDSNNWGTAGSNGGTVTFTGLNQTLEGSISVDTISSLDLYLLEGTTWTGSAEITDNSENTSASDAPITVNVDGTSTWVVTADTTISNLNVADGGTVVDADGNTVTIVADGETVAEGTGNVTVTVTGSYSTEVTTGDANAIATEMIDRSGFDSYYGTDTAFSLTGDTSDITAKSTETATEENSSDAEDAADGNGGSGDAGQGSNGNGDAGPGSDGSRDAGQSGDSV